MEPKQIDQILEKYWAGESSLEEEKQLKKYFQQGAIEDRHLAFQSLFQWMDAEKSIGMSPDFDQKLLQRLEEEISPDPVQLKPRKRSPVLVNYLMRIAAALVLVFALWSLFPKPSESGIAEVDQQEIEEAKRTYQQAKVALLFLSRKMNKGTETAAQGISELEQATARLKTK